MLNCIYVLLIYYVVFIIRIYLELVTYIDVFHDIQSSFNILTPVVSVLLTTPLLLRGVSTSRTSVKMVPSERPRTRSRSSFAKVSRRLTLAYPQFAHSIHALLVTNENNAKLLYKYKIIQYQQSLSYGPNSGLIESVMSCGIEEIQKKCLCFRDCVFKVEYMVYVEVLRVACISVDRVIRSTVFLRVFEVMWLIKFND